MDLIVSIILLVGISSYKMMQKPVSVQSCVTSETGEVITTSVNESNLIVGTNLYLRKEPRAYHKILDEMGLS